MSPITTEQMTRLQGHYQQKYGIKPDETVTSILCEIEQMGKRNAQILQTIRQHPTPSIQFTNTQQAFWYGLGKYSWGIGILLFLLVFHLFRHNGVSPDALYQDLIKSGQIHSSAQGTFLVLRPAPLSASKVGKTYYYHRNQQVIYVPLRLVEQK